ncbi:PAS domain S-box protein [Cyanobacteria bacterium FACHB-63]|nr:PAS domain S-box protein [Cyanobacteria bacterium FACHB-63]
MTLNHQSTAPFTIAQLDSHQIFESLQDCVKILDLEGRLCYMNKLEQQLLDIDNFDDYCGQAWTNLWQGKDQQAAIDAIEAAKSGNSGKFQGSCLTTNGTLRWWDVTVSPIRNAQGEIEQLLSVSRDITDLKQTEQQLRQQQAQLEMFVKYVPAEVAMLDREMRYLCVSDRWLSSYGLTSQEVMGRSHYEIFPNLPPEWREVHQRCLAGAVEQCDEDPFLHDGGFDWIRWEIRPWYTETTEIGGIIIFSEVITERKRAEQQLQLYADVVQNTQVGIVVWQLETANDPGSFRLLITNAAASEITAVNFAALIGQTMATCFPKLLQTSLVQQYLQVVQTQQAIDFGEVPYSADGVQMGTYTLKAFPLPNQCIGLAFENVTARKALETALSESEERFRRMTEAIQDVFWISVPAEQRLIYVSPAYEQVWGRSRAGVYANYQDWIEAIHPDDRPRVQENVQALLQVGQYDVEYRIVRPDSKIRWVRDRGFPIAEPTGEIRQVAGVAEDITDRKVAEIALLESEQRFRLMADAVPQIVWITNAEGRVEFFNKQWSNYTGAPYEPMTAAEVAANFIHPEDSDRTIAAFNEARRTRGIFSVEHRVRSEAGIYRWFLVRAESYQDPQTGEIIRWFGASVDIHERKQAEEQLSERQQRLTIATEAAQLGIFEWKVPGDITVWENDRMYELFGFQPTDGSISAQEFFEQYLHPDDARGFTDKLTQAMQMGSLRQANYRIRRRDGTIRWLEVNGQFEFAADGSPLRFIGVNADITDRKQAEVELQQSEARYRLLAEAIPQFVWITDAAGLNEYVNQQFCDYTGLTTEQMLGLNWLSIIHPDDLEMTRDRWLAAVNSGQFYEIEYRFRKVDGSYRWFLGQGIPLKDEQGCIRQWFGTCTDIEPQKQIEQARLRLFQQEQTAREQAENANRIKDEFLAVLSHELRSPLNPILGWSKLLQRGNLDETRTKAALATIDRNALLQAQLIDDLLDISRILRGKLSLDAAPVDLREVIAAALETVHLAAEAKSMHIQTTISPDVGIVVGDAGRLQQVVWNLLSNAVKFTPQNGQIFVTLTQTGTDAQIQVKDTGKGINLEFLPFVFEHFRQEDGATTRKFGGLGLGLSIARQIVELHGGKITVDSLGEGQGAIFTVQIPLAPQSSELTSPESALVAVEEGLQGMHILVVDDEPDSREFVTFVLEQAGAIVTSSSSGIEALQITERAVPDLIVSDIGMPEMDGYMLMQQVRRLEQGRTVPAIALTAYAGEFDRQQALKAGFQQHLAKPVEPAEIVTTVARLCEQKEGTAA